MQTAGCYANTASSKSLYALVLARPASLPRDKIDLISDPPWTVDSLLGTMSFALARPLISGPGFSNRLRLCSAECRRRSVAPRLGVGVHRACDDGQRGDFLFLRESGHAVGRHSKFEFAQMRILGGGHHAHVHREPGNDQR